MRFLRHSLLLLACTPVTALAEPSSHQDHAAAEAAIKAGLETLSETMQQASALETEGRIQEAEPHWRKALNLRQALLGTESPAMAPGQARLARNIEMQGRFREAEPLRRSALERLQNDPASSLELPAAYTALGYNLTMQGQLSEGATYGYRALELLRAAGKDDDLDASQSLSTVGLILNKQHRFAEAEPFYRRALTIRQRLLGEDDLDTATSYNNLGAALSGQGKAQEADGYFRRALTIRQANGTVPALVAQNAFNIALNLDRLGKRDEAVAYYEQSIAQWTGVFGRDHVQTAAGHNGLGLNYYQQGRHAEAADLFRQSLSVREKTLGKYHPDVAESYGNLGLAQRALGQEKQAQKQLSTALEISERTVGADHPDTTSLRAALETAPAAKAP